MARLVAVCRDGEEEFPFEKRQIPLYIDDTLTVSAGPAPLGGGAAGGERGLRLRRAGRAERCGRRGAAPKAGGAAAATFRLASSSYPQSGMLAYNVFAI
uniref:Uncharacterized protein n=1 Tax=Meleagris gallopavo TaxID=9103 RepID=A0A803XXX7_MELGA